MRPRSKDLDARTRYDLLLVEWPACRRPAAPMASRSSPSEVDALYESVKSALDAVAANGRRVGDCKFGVYLFYDYDGEPIYVGQTQERLRTRIRRHLTNQRTDAVAMRVLDPFEVAEIEMWPFWALTKQDAAETLDRAEFTVYCRALERSEFNAILNEGDIRKADKIALPPSVRAPLLTGARRVRGNCKCPIRGNRKRHSSRLAVGGASLDAVGFANSHGATRRCTDGRRGCC